MPLTETLPPADTPLPADHNGHASHENAVLRPRRAARRDWFRAGFFFAAGVLVLGVLALVTRHVLDATLAVLTPFVVGIVLALLLDPLADRLEKRGMSRALAAGIVFGGLLVLLIGSGILLFPKLAQQASDLATNAPTFIAGVRDKVNAFLTTHHKIGPLTMPANFQQLSDKVTGYAGTFLQNAGGRTAGFLVGSVTLVIQTVLTLILTFFLLLDIDRMRARLFFFAPERWRPLMAGVGNDVGEVFANYLSGLLRVCAMYGVAVIVLLYGLSLFHHALARYALLVGVAAGVLYAVPYIGAIATALVTFLVAFAAGAPDNQGLQFGLIAVGSSLILNQVFDNIVTPRVVGGGVGLNPVISIFALVLGAELFGIWGMLLSVPVAGSIQAALFRLFPRLTEATPAPFLRAQGVPDREKRSPKILDGEHS